MLARNSTIEVARQCFRGQFVRVTKMALSQVRVTKVVEGDPAQGDVSPHVVAAPLERIAEGVSGRFGVAGFPEFDPFLVVQLHLTDALGMDKNEVITAQPLQTKAASIRCASLGASQTRLSTGRDRPTSPPFRGRSILTSPSAPSFDH